MTFVAFIALFVVAVVVFGVAFLAWVLYHEKMDPEEDKTQDAGRELG